MNTGRKEGERGMPGGGFSFLSGLEGRRGGGRTRGGTGGWISVDKGCLWRGVKHGLVCSVNTTALRGGNGGLMIGRERKGGMGDRRGEKGKVR